MANRGPNWRRIMFTLTINGEARTFPNPLTVADLLHSRARA